MICTDCGTPMQPRTKGTALAPGHRWHDAAGLCSACSVRARRRDAKAGHVKTTPCTNPDAALAGTCTCTCCEHARRDRESAMNAGPSYISRNGIRRWVG